MLKRQAASSLPALIEQTLRINEGVPLLDLDELWETEDGEAPDTVITQAQTIRRDPAFRLIVDRHKDIEKADTLVPPPWLTRWNAGLRLSVMGPQDLRDIYR